MEKKMEITIVSWGIHWVLTRLPSMRYPTEESNFKCLFFQGSENHAEKTILNKKRAENNAS